MGVVTCCSMTLCEPLSYPAVSIASREPKRICVIYCYSTALQNGGEYTENSILPSMIYDHAHAGTLPQCWYLVLTLDTLIIQYLLLFVG